MHLAVADVNESGDVAAQVQQRMHLDGGLGATKVRPRKDAQAEVDGGGIERVSCLIQFHREAVVGAELAGGLDETHGEIREDAAVAGFVGIGHCAARNAASDAKMIELGLMSAQTGFDVAQAFAVSQLCECHAEELIEMRKRLGRIFGRITLDTAAERVKG